MKVTFIGATHEVTGSCTLLEVNDKRILVDCGMEQGRDLFENIEIPVAPADLDAIVLTHAHIDHSGKLPFLVSQGYKGPVYSTEATRHLCNIMLITLEKCLILCFILLSFCSALIKLECKIPEDMD